MSVAWAPRARIAVNASWPGVSRKVTLPWLVSTWYAPMCWVIPPNSRSATLVVRIASSSEVLPWSTWPMTVTTGGRGRICAGSDSSSSSTSPSSERTCTSQWNLSATSLAAVGSSTSLTVAITPRSTSALITSEVLRRIAAASSPTVTDSGSLISSRLISCGGSGGGGRAPPGSSLGAAGADHRRRGDRGRSGRGGHRGSRRARGRGGARSGPAGAAGRGGEITVRGGFSGGGTGARRTGGAGRISTGGASGGRTDARRGRLRGRGPGRCDRRRRRDRCGGGYDGRSRDDLGRRRGRNGGRRGPEDGRGGLRRVQRGRRRELDHLGRLLDGLRGGLLRAGGRLLLRRGGGRFALGRLRLGRALGLGLGGQIASAAQLDPQLVGRRGEERAHGPHALVAHAFERHDQILAGDAQLLRQIDDLDPCRHARYLLGQLARMTTAGSCGGRLAPLNACPSRPACSAFSTHSVVAHTYAPRPAARPSRSTLTTPPSSRTSRINSAFARTTRQPMQVR